MPKALAPLNDFSGGLNTGVNERDIEDTQYIIGDDIDSSIHGRLRCIGQWVNYVHQDNNLLGEYVDSVLGYGIFSFPVDFDFDSPPSAVQGRYIAIYQPVTTEIIFYVAPQIDNSNWIGSGDGIINLSAAAITALGGDGASTTTSKISYTYIDGSLRVHDEEHHFSPQKLYYRGERRFFYHTHQPDNNANATGVYEDVLAGWRQDNQFVRSPYVGIGTCIDVNKSSSTLTIGSIDLTESSKAIQVGLIIRGCPLGSDAFVKGWGKSLTENSDPYNFYATLVYDGNQESLPSLLGQATNLGGLDSGTVNNDLTFTAVVKPRESDGHATFHWNPRITSVRIYYRKADADENIIYFIGDYPTSGPEDSTDVLCQIDTNGYAYLSGDETGKSSNTVSIGIYHETPPIIFTHAVKSGIRPETVSVECKYATSAIVNRKLYVGNIKQKTKDSPDAETVYEDRLLKSIPGRFDVLPDTDFVDVAIRDGEKIIKLIGFGNRLLQFKERTLYVIAVAGGEEYLEAKFPDMGIVHPNAVCEFQGGIFWVNEFGAYVFDGQKAPVNIVSNKISYSDWRNFVGLDTIVSYIPSGNKLCVIGNAKTIWSADAPYGEVYYFNLDNASWNKQTNFGTANPTTDKREGISNIINYQDVNGVNHTVALLYGDNQTNPNKNAELLEFKDIESLSAPFPLRPVKFRTKEYTFKTPHQKKRIYGCYITYKGNMTQDNDSVGTSYIMPKVSLLVRNRDDALQQPITLEPKTTLKDFEDTAGDWKVAHYIVPSAQRSKTRNVYGVNLQIEQGDSSTGIDTSFQINDISLIMRMKTPA